MHDFIPSFGNYLSFLLKSQRFSPPSNPRSSSYLNAIYFSLLALKAVLLEQWTQWTHLINMLPATERHNYQEENLSTKSKTPLNEKIYVRLEMQMHVHAFTHATMLRRQLTFKPKKIKFLNRHEYDVLEKFYLKGVFPWHVFQTETIFDAFDNQVISISMIH